MSRTTRMHAWIDRALLGELPPAQRRELFAALRGDDQLRARYDRAALALRILEGDAAVAPCEVDLVESWLLADLGATPSMVDHVRGWLSVRTWLSVFAAAAAALLVVLLARTPGPEQPYEGIKGGGPTPRLSIEVLCHDAGGRMVAAQDEGCDHDDTIAFSYRVERPASGMLTLFGVDAHGDPMYYAPTPDDPHAIAVKSGDTQPVGAGVMLRVNHAAGPARVYGLLSAVAPTLPQIDALAAALADWAPARPGDAAWIDRVRRADPSLVRTLCPTRPECHAAELVFEIRPQETTR